MTKKDKHESENQKMASDTSKPNDLIKDDLKIEPAASKPEPHQDEKPEQKPEQKMPQSEQASQDDKPEEDPHVVGGIVQKPDTETGLGKQRDELTPRVDDHGNKSWH
jgi:hypothetical protein